MCATVTPIAGVATRVALIAHHTEWSKSSNTGRLLLGLLPGTVVHLRGDPTGPRPRGEASPPLPGRRLVLFPSESSRELTRDDRSADLVLVVPEGSWAQARRAVKREPWAVGAEHVRLPSGASSRYRLRQAVHEDGLSTFEAVARALAVLEGGAVHDAMIAVFERFVVRSLAVRGRRSHWDAPT